MIDKRKNRRLGIILFSASILMFGFGFALVPLYNVLCNALGINGKTNTTPVAEAYSPIDKSRVVTVQFIATNNENLPWDFHPSETQVKVHPGENRLITYFAKNNAGKTMTIQAVPSVTPGIAAKYLRKTECFCFTQQTLMSGKSMLMPMKFHLDRDLPKNINTVTIAYTVFNTTGQTRGKSSKAGRISK